MYYMFPSMRLLYISSQPTGDCYNPNLDASSNAEGTETFSSTCAENWKHI